MFLLWAIVISILFSAFFSGMEIAFVTSNKLRMELDRKQGLFAARILTILSKDPSQYITTMLVGNNIALVVYGIVMAMLLEPAIQVFIDNETTIIIIQTIISTLILLFTAEFYPKTLVQINPNGILNFFAFPLFLVYVILFPISKSIMWISNVILRVLFKSKPSNQPDNITFNKIDLAYLVNEISEDTTEQQAGENDIRLFQNALEFSKVKIRDCMIPRNEIIAVEHATPIEEIKQKFIESGFSKILIYKEDFDNIIGYLTSKSLFKNPQSIRNRIIDISFVPETKPANRMLRKLIQERKSLAVVVDEFGGVSGLITIEDIIEEIFGEIEDEHDTSELVEKQVNEKEFILSARLEIDYLNDNFGLNIPESDEYDTLAGFIIFHYENIPKTRDIITIDRFEIKILKGIKTKINLVYLTITNGT